MNECSCMTCKKEIIILKQEIERLQDKTKYLLDQLKVTDSIVNKLDLKLSSQ